MKTKTWINRKELENFKKNKNPLSARIKSFFIKSVYATDSTFFPDTGSGSTTVDGRMRIGPVSTFDLARDGATAGAVDVTTANNLDTETQRAGGNWYMYRAGMTFDTSAIPDGDTISAATLSLYFTTTWEDANDGNDYISIDTFSPASNNNLVGGDYDSFGGVKQTDDIDITNITTSQYNVFTFSTYTNIDKTGISKFLSREGHDWEDSAPSLGADEMSGARANQADTAGTTTDPKLLVTHSSAPADTCTAPTAEEDWYVRATDNCYVSANTTVNGGLYLLSDEGQGSFNIIDNAVLSVGSINTTSTPINVDAGCTIEID